MQTEILNASSPTNILDQQVDLGNFKSQSAKNASPKKFSTSQQWELQPKIIEVETLFIGGGPATLGILSNAF